MGPARVGPTKKGIEMTFKQWLKQRKPEIEDAVKAGDMHAIEVLLENCWLESRLAKIDDNEDPDRLVFVLD